MVVLQSATIFLTENLTFISFSKKTLLFLEKIAYDSLLNKKLFVPLQPIWRKNKWIIYKYLLNKH